jgi:hypothetical protein
LRIVALNFDRPARMQPAGLLLRCDHPTRVRPRAAHEQQFDRTGGVVKLLSGARES